MNHRSLLSSAGLKDLVSLTKPRITFFCVLMTWVGLFATPEHASLKVWLAALIGTALSVSSANVLNMYWERDVDKLMRRTAARPLPSGRLPATAALWFGILLGIISVAVLWIANPVTALLGLSAILMYVLIYTPLKRISPSALVIGAVPGAMPPLLGTAAASGVIDGIGMMLFFVLLFWQIPHFVAIAMQHQTDYQRAGIKTIPAVKGHRTALWYSLFYSFLLFIASAALPMFGAGKALYLVVAVSLGSWMVFLCARALTSKRNVLWSRKIFVASLIYLPALCLALMVDALL